jgi:signal transduction histidine kinase
MFIMKSFSLQSLVLFLTQVKKLASDRIPFCISRKWAMCCCLLFLFFTNFYLKKAEAQSPLYQEVFHYTSDKGMPQNLITSMVADTSGYIWIGTRKGLVRFDGHRLRVFRFSDISEDCGDAVYNVAWINGRLVAEEEFYSNTFIIKDGNTIVPYKSGLWGDSLYINPVTKNYYLYRKHWLNSISGDYIPPGKVIALDSSGFTGYYLTETNDIFYFNQQGKRYTGINANIGAAEILGYVFLINTTIYALGNEGVLKCSDRGNKAIAAKGTLPLLLKTISFWEKVKSTEFIQAGKNVFFHYLNKLFLVIERSPGVIDVELLSNTVYKESIGKITFLPEKNLLLIAAAKEGFYFFRKKYFSSRFYRQKEASVKEESPSRIYSIQRLNDSLLLSRRGILSLSGNTRIFPAQIDFTFALPKSTAGYLINRENNRPGLIVRDTSMRELANLETTVPHALITSFFNDGDTTYLAEKDGRILKLLLTSGSPFRKLEEIKPLGSIEIITMLKLPGDSVWIGTRGKGLYIMSLTTKRLRQIKELSALTITNLYADKSGTVWISVYGIGFFRYSQRDGLKRMPLDRNKNLSFSYAVAEDKNGFMWISTENGLFRFLKTDLDAVSDSETSIYYNYFTREYGFLTNEFNGGCNPAVVVLNDGRFVFPSMKGLVIFDPLKVPLELPDTAISISDITLDNIKINAVDKLVLTPAFNNLAMKISTHYLGHPYNLQLEYRLSGGESGWTPVGADGQINFNRLRYGEYTLTIRMLRGYGSTQYTYKIIHFSVRPFWHQTWWFYGFLILLAMLMLAIFLQSRNKKIQRQKELLEMEVAQRTEDLWQSERKVKQNARFKSQVTSLVLHDVRSPLYYLNKITGSIYNASKGEVPEFFREQLKELHLSVKEVSEYAQNLFAWVSAQQDEFVMRPTIVKLPHLLQELCANYHLLATENKNTITHNADDSLAMVTQADLLQIVLRNLVDNAIKYTQGGHIILSAREKNNSMQIIVQDTGKGMAQEKINRLMAEGGDQTVNTRSGMGYRYIRDLLIKMGGKLFINSEEGVGTEVTILLPVNKDKTTAGMG